MTDDQNGVISCVWIPAGQWRQEQKILTDDPLNRGQYNQVGISNVTIRGAGMWHSQLYTLTEPQNVVGSINHPHEGNFGFDIDDNTQISDIAIFGSGRIRGGDGNDEGGVGLNGRFGQNTKITNVWIEHANVGAWVGRDYDNIPALWGPGDGLRVQRHAHPQHLRRRHQLHQRHAQLAGVQLVVPHHRRRRAGGLGQQVREGPGRSTSRTTTTSSTTPSSCPGARTASRSTAATTTRSRTT